MSTSPADFNVKIIEEFRSHDGVVGGMFENTPLLLLHHTGAKSGTDYVNPLAYLRDGDRYVIFASKGGAPDNPGWYHNLKAHPRRRSRSGPTPFRWPPPRPRARSATGCSPLRPSGPPPSPNTRPTPAA
jgi:deazaflavin-dependent oxidoreductase (nitroreductase family)